VKLQGELTINGKVHRAGDELPWTRIYPFFLLHMAMFGGSGFFMAYGDKSPSVAFLYMHGGIAVFVYLMFYLSIFGREEVKWLLINSALGIFGIYTEIGWLLSLFGRTADQYPWYIHVIPFLYYVLYTFLLRQMVLDLTGARNDPTRKKVVEGGYVAISVAVYAGLKLL
jgi:predicted permease